LDETLAVSDPDHAAEAIVAEIRDLPVRNTPNVRAVRRRYSRRIQRANPEFVLELARMLLKKYGYRWLAYELIANHAEAFKLIGEAELEALGRGIDSWGSVDAFARILAGPVWLNGQVPDSLIDRWARSEDHWWRRAALVSTVALNVRSHGGLGDVERTLGVCRLLAADEDNMVIKALSWALRELVVHDAKAVKEFLDEHDGVLAARVKREVQNKLATGRKHP
jgi:3-methyladenine DNA glycosylase AlkD